jgi:hypothetical protein
MLLPLVFGVKQLMVTGEFISTTAETGYNDICLSRLIFCGIN